MQFQIRKKTKRSFALLLAFLIVLTTVFQVITPKSAMLVWGNADDEQTTDEPLYSTAEHALKYSNDNFLLSAQTSKDFGVTIPADITYYVTYTVKTQGDCWFNFRGDTGRIFIGATQYSVVGVENTQWIQKAGLAQAEEGVRITICSSKDKATVWLNGEKIVDNAALTATDKAGQPSISWVTDSATFTNVKVWISKSDDAEKPEDSDAGTSDEPKYNADTDKLWYDKASLELDAFSSKEFGLKFKAEDTYFVSYRAKTQGDIYFNFRGNTGRLYIGASQYCVIGVENEKWVQEAGLAKTENGAKITIKSTGDKASVWLNGKKVVDEANLVTTGEYGTPMVSWTTETTTLKDVKVWADKSVQTVKDGDNKEPDIIDENEPKYDKSKHSLKFSNNKIGISAEGRENFGVTIAAGNTYFTSFVLKTQGDFYYDFRGDTGRVYIGASQYCILGVENEKWVQSSGLASGADGVRVTICSAGDIVSVWFNGVKVADNEKLNVKGQLGLPKVTWTTDKVTLENVKVWTAKNQDDTVRPEGSDEPTYNAKTDYKYDIQRVTEGTYKNGTLTLKPQKSSFILSELPYNASYYMVMTIKTSGAVNIQSRNKEDIFNMSKDGYTSLATGQKWIDKKFPTLVNGARITFYSTAKRLVVWVDGEKIVDGKYVNKGTAQPGIGWSFDNEVTVSNICIWTKKQYQSDEPVYNKSIDTLHDFTYGGKVKLKGKTAQISPHNIVGFVSDFDADADYYMSLTVKTEQSVNIMYRNPDGFICLSQDGYVSSGTNGKWIKKTFYKLSSGMRVTFHSTPEKISIWADGEKLVDESYSKNGEAYPGIAWSFDKTVEVSDIKLWSGKTTEHISLGVIENTGSSSLSADKTYQVGLLGESGNQNYVDKQPMPKNVYKVLDNTVLDSSVNIIEAEDQEEKSFPLIPIAIGIIGVAVVAAVSLLVFAGRRNRNLNK